MVHKCDYTQYEDFMPPSLLQVSSDDKKNEKV